MVKLQYIRNINLHKYENIVCPHIITPKTPYLALCGNIIDPTKYNYRIYRSFLRYCSNNWDRVFYVPGPTENEFSSAVQELCKEYRDIHYLDFDIYKVPNKSLYVLGSTFINTPSSDKWIRDAIYTAKDENSNLLLLSYDLPPLLIQHPKEL